MYAAALDNQHCLPVSRATHVLAANYVYYTPTFSCLKHVLFVGYTFVSLNCSLSPTATAGGGGKGVGGGVGFFFGTSTPKATYATHEQKITGVIEGIIIPAQLATLG